MRLVADRLGRRGWRPASQFNDDFTDAKWFGVEHPEGFRRDAENGGRDDRAPQNKYPKQLNRSGLT
ncbi:MAG TPA: hypothetical protein VHZ30_05630, partial [Verrucomicrobiae bacterium]|nr:hypothetical protein [Verrucomicrobiae bacterium]